MVVCDSFGAMAFHLSLLSLACTESTACSPCFHLSQPRLNQGQCPNISEHVWLFVAFDYWPIFCWESNELKSVQWFWKVLNKFSIKCKKMHMYIFLWVVCNNRQSVVNCTILELLIALRGTLLWYMPSPAQGTHAVMYHLGEWQLALSVAIFSIISWNPVLDFNDKCIPIPIPIGISWVLSRKKLAKLLCWMNMNEYVQQKCNMSLKNGSDF